MARPRPTEVRKIRELLLNEEWADETECAEAIIRELDALRVKDRTYYVLVVQYQVVNESGPAVITNLYGPYETKLAAERAYKNSTGQIEGAHVAVTRLILPQQAGVA